MNIDMAIEQLWCRMNTEEFKRSIEESSLTKQQEERDREYKMNIEEIKSDKGIQSLLVERLHAARKCSAGEAEKLFKQCENYIMDKFISVCVNAKQSLHIGITARQDNGLMWIGLDRTHKISQKEGVNLSTLTCTCNPFTYELEPLGLPCWHIMALVFLTSGFKAGNSLIKVFKSEIRYKRGLTLDRKGEKE